jgi:hypothetical protein
LFRFAIGASSFTNVFGVFKFLMYLGVVLGLAGFAMPYLADVPAVASLPAQTKTILSFGGLGLIVIGLIGRTATRPDPTL